MKIINGDIWKFHQQGALIGITTNGTIKNDGELVMGKGIALQAAEKYRDLPMILGSHVNFYGNTICVLPVPRLFSFPVKHQWWEPADLNLIEQSAQQLADYFCLQFTEDYLYMPKPGCGAGGLEWRKVEPILHAYLNDLVTIVDWR